MVKHLNIHVYGLVQNVLFRYATLHKAEELGIKGFVVNKPGGSVYIEAEGEENSLQKLIEWCQIGPELATVEKVEAKEDMVKNYNNFQIR